jgi:hypothetical protein
MGNRLRRHRHGGRRLVRYGAAFTSDELDAGEIELELPDPSGDPPPDGQQAEPWNAAEGDPRFAARLRLYRERFPGAGP